MKRHILKLIKHWQLTCAVIGFVITSVIWVHDVTAYGPRIDSLETSSARIERKLDYLMIKLGYPYRTQ